MTPSAALGECLSLRRHRLALIGSLVVLHALWSLRLSLTLPGNADMIAATTVGGSYTWLLSSRQYYQNGLGRRTTATTLASSTTFNTSIKEKKSHVGNRSRSGITIDIISIGSIHRPEYQNVQEETFGSHEAVRNFFRFNEGNDSFEPHCHSNLTMEHVKKICNFCHTHGPYNHIWRMRGKFARFQWLQQKFNAPGWICAQKRLPSGLARVLKAYQQQQQVFPVSTPTATRSNNATSSTITLPAYLLMMDDDTYLNMPNVIHTLPREYPWDAAHVVAGCLVQERIQEVNFTFPFGGWSTILSARAIQNFIRPIHCNNINSDINSSYVTYDVTHDEVAAHNEFVTAACSRLSDNLIGEKGVFKNGMSIAHLMDAYITKYPYLDINKWNGVGYCLHSDWVVGFFVNFYNIATSHHAHYDPNYPHNLMQGYMNSNMYTGRQTSEVKARYKECSHDSNEKCTMSAHICHYITPDRMRTLYDQTTATS
jgi:hypothetical protein